MTVRLSSRGLTLIEMMLAMLGLSLLLGVILSSISANLRLERNADLRATAIRMASSEMARVRMTEFDQLDSLSHSEVIPDVAGKEYRLKTAVARDPAFPDETRSIVITVTWTDGARHLKYETQLVRSRL